MDATFVGFVVFLDHDLGEEGLVEQATDVAVGFEVGGPTVTQEVEDLAQGGAGGLVAGLDFGELLLDSAESVDDAFLLVLEQVDRDGAGVVRVEQLLALSAWLLGDPVASGGSGLRSPGLYSWWVDEQGAADLTAGLGHAVAPGLIYAGLAGATRSGGSTSKNTLWGRIATMHLGKKHEFSTLRRSLGSIVASAFEQSTIDEEQLTQWMYAHLRVVTVPVDDADSLGDLETAILKELDPPFNLAKVKATPLRRQLKALRKTYAGRSRDEGAAE